MRIPRIFCPQALVAGARISLDESASQHLARVLRVRVDDPLVLFNGHGGEYSGRVVEINRRDVQVEVATFVDVSRESPLRTTLIQGVSRGERMDYTIQKAVELGVRRIAPVSTERTVVRLDAERRDRKQAHWQGVVTSASEQSGRTEIPVVEPLTDFARRIAAETAPIRVVLHPEGAMRLSQLHRPDGDVALLVGPEGGLTDSEIELAIRHGFSAMALGPRIFRTETAGVVALAALQLTWGDLA